ncbi:MAG: hypothetical protein HY737_07345 [Candidatus Omnitrophica bacterium]|nr:hypothetical protein [Candidatus Omnitrophota bacterium]
MRAPRLTRQLLYGFLGASLVMLAVGAAVPHHHDAAGVCKIHGHVPATPPQPAIETASPARITPMASSPAQCLRAVDVIRVTLPRAPPL